VRECVQAHDGTVELVRSSEFPGAHFKIVIPQSRAVEPQAMAANA
jgi:signal transduction histidine kinase